MPATCTAKTADLAVTTAGATAAVRRDASIQAALDGMVRPRLLVEAARRGMSTYQRRRDLRRMLRVAIPANVRLALEKLIPIEADLEQRRVSEGKGYAATRHVDILIALMSEARDLKAERPAAPAALRAV
jgi:hypothetical protein